MDNKNYSVRMPALRREWVKCPYCHAKHSLYANNAECEGVYVKCTRGCGREFEIKVHKGKQI